MILCYCRSSFRKKQLYLIDWRVEGLFKVSVDVLEFVWKHLIYEFYERWFE